jgi:hypothetical protein
LRAGAGKQDYAYAIVGDQLLEGGVEFADHRRVKGVEHLGSRHGDLRYARLALLDIERVEAVHQ